jgi:3-oxoacyl-[acyl-carrier protein] reductase
MNDRKLFQKIAIVTGASRGIGRAIALRLAHDGASVVVNYAKNKGAADEVVGLITQSGGDARAIQADMAQVTEVRRLFAETKDLVNNAGHATFAPITDVSEAEFDRLFALNTKGVYFALQEASRLMADGGRIINISSGITIGGGPGGALYAGTKGAIEQFTMAVAKELGARGITVNTVSPGMTETDLLGEVLPVERREEAVKSITLGRFGTPDDIANIIAMLASADGAWITGQNIRATGGAS